MKPAVRAVYRLQPGVKQDSARRWALPDRIFFAHGACHILAGVFLRNPPLPGFYAERIVPGEGFAGNHLFVTDGRVAFDFRGYSGRMRLLPYHAACWSRQYGPGWNCTLERVEFDLLDTTELNRRRMLGPDQYQGDAIGRARDFIARVDHDEAWRKAAATVT